MTAVIQRLAFELERQRENETHEREKLALRLENILLRERALPSGSDRREPNIEELLLQLEALKTENEELRRQLSRRRKD